MEEAVSVKEIGGHWRQGFGFDGFSLGFSFTDSL